VKLGRTIQRKLEGQFKEKLGIKFLRKDVLA